MNAYEHFALNEYLSAFPNDLTFEGVLDLLLDEDDEVCVWEAFEYHSPTEVADYITALRDNLVRHFIPREEKDNV